MIYTVFYRIFCFYFPWLLRGVYLVIKIRKWNLMFDIIMITVSIKTGSVEMKVISLYIIWTSYSANKFNSVKVRCIPSYWRSNWTVQLRLLVYGGLQLVRDDLLRFKFQIAVHSHCFVCEVLQLAHNTLFISNMYSQSKCRVVSLNSFE